MRGEPGGVFKGLTPFSLSVCATIVNIIYKLTRAGTHTHTQSHFLLQAEPPRGSPPLPPRLPLPFQLFSLLCVSCSFFCSHKTCFAASERLLSVHKMPHDKNETKAPLGLGFSSLEKKNKSEISVGPLCRKKTKQVAVRQ